MLPTQYEPTIYRFRIDERGGHTRLLMTTTFMEAQAKTRPIEPLWWREMGDIRTLNAVVNWLQLRRASWNAWGKMAETQGREALATHLGDLLNNEPPENVTGVLIERCDDARQLSIGDLVTTPKGIEKRVYYTHTFADESLRNAFHGWLLNNNPEGNSNALLEAGLQEGTAHVGKLMDGIAAEELAKAQTA